MTTPANTHIEVLSFSIWIRCSGCREALSVAGIGPSQLCPSCGVEVVVALDEFWRPLIDSKRVAAALRLDDGDTARVQMFIDHHPEMVYGRAPVRCGACATELAPSTLLPGSSCHECGAAVGLREADAFVRALVPDARYVVGEGPMRGGDSTRGSAAAGITIRCDQCGASLPIDGSTRSPDCTYCGASNYLPDGVWLRLHPPSEARTFHVVSELGPERALLAQIDHPECAAEIARQPALPLAVALRLAAHERQSVQAVLAANPDAPVEALRALPTNLLAIAEPLAQNASTPSDVLGALLRDGTMTTSVQTMAVAHPATPRADLEALAKRTELPELIVALQGRGLTPALLENPRAHYHLLTVRSLDAAHVARLAKSPDSIVRAAALRHPNLPASVRRGRWAGPVAFVAFVVLGLVLLFVAALAR